MTLCFRMSDSRFQIAADKCAPSLSEAIMLRSGSRECPNLTFMLCCSRTEGSGGGEACAGAMLSRTAGGAR